MPAADVRWRSEEHTSELQSRAQISYAVCCLKKKNDARSGVRLRLPTLAHIAAGRLRNGAHTTQAVILPGCLMGLARIAFYSSPLRRPPLSNLDLTLFPYTPLFR